MRTDRERIMPQLKKKDREKITGFQWILLGFIAAQLLMIAYVNLTQLRALTNYDSSISYLLTQRMWQPPITQWRHSKFSRMAGSPTSVRK